MEAISQKLRSAREALGITLEQAEDETKIRRKYLEALEAANEADIPGEVYLKGFLRTYGNYIGLDGPELVEAYKDAMAQRNRQDGEAREESGSDRDGTAGATAAQREPGGAMAEQRASAGATGKLGGGAPAGAAATAAARPRPPRERPRRPADRSAGRSAGRPAGLNRRSGLSPGARLLLFTIVLLAAVAYVGWLIFRQVGPASGPPPSPTTPVQQIGVPDPTPKPPEPAPAPPAPTVTMTRGQGEDVIFTVAAKEIQVKIEPGTRPVWLLAEADGTRVFEGTTSKPFDVTGTKIRIRAGHMDGVSVTVNGQRFDKPLGAITYNLIFNGQ